MGTNRTQLRRLWKSVYTVHQQKVASVMGLPVDGPDVDLTRAPFTIRVNSLELLRLRIEKKKEINFR
jgi:hypothetical protein